MLHHRIRIRITAPLTAVAVAAGAGAAIAATPVSGTFKGKTAQKLAATLKVKPSHKKVSGAIRYDAKCTDGSHLNGTLKGSSSVSRKGKFSYGGGSSTGQSGIEVDTAYQVSGRFKTSHKAVGTIDYDLQEYNGVKLVNECKTGKLKFTARH